MDNKKIEDDCKIFLKKNKHAIINLRTGFGKSKIVHDFVEGYKNKKIVFMVPKTIVLQWRKYFPKSRNEITIITLSEASAKKHRKELQSADFIIIDEPKLFKSNTGIWRFFIDNEIHCEKKIWLDATIIENSLEELDFMRGFFDGISRDRLQKAIFHRNVKMPRNIVKKTLHVVLPKSVKRSMLYDEWQLLQALRNKKKFMIYKFLMENIRKLSSVADKRDIGWHKIAALKELILRKDASRGIIFSTSKDAVHAMVKVLKAVGKRVSPITGDTKQKDREAIRDEFNSYKLDWIVGTRAVERGLDLPSGICVINYDIPFSGSSYTQRDRVTRRCAYGVKTTTIFTIQVDDSVEELQREIVKSKIAMDKNLQNGVVKAVSAPRWIDFMENLVARRKKLCSNTKRK